MKKYHPGTDRLWWLGFGISDHENANGRQPLAEMPILVLQL